MQQLVVVVSVLLFILCADARDVYISPDGVDQIDCGTNITYACKFQYAFSWVILENDTALLASGTHEIAGTSSIEVKFAGVQIKGEGDAIIQCLDSLYFSALKFSANGTGMHGVSFSGCFSPVRVNEVYSNILFSNCEFNGISQMMRLQGSENVRIVNSTFNFERDNNETYQNALVVQDSKHVVFENIKFIGIDDTFIYDADTSFYGLAVHIATSVNISFVDCQIFNNSKKYVGAVRAIFSSISFTNTLFENNYAEQSYGGAIDSDSSTVNLQNCTFSGNSGPNGGALREVNSTVIVVGCKFHNNSGLQGGAVYSEVNGNNSTLSFDRCVFSNNRASSALGGAIRVRTTANNDYAQLSISNSEFVGNVAEGGSPKGGAIYGSIQYVVISNSTFINNGAQDGGAIYGESTFGQTFLLDNCTFNSNYAIVGGALHATDRTFIVKSSRFVLNMAQGGKGGAIFTQGAKLNISDSMFDSNGSPQGGAINSEEASMVSTSNCIFQNHNSTSVGAIYAFMAIYNDRASMYVSNQANQGSVAHFYNTTSSFVGSEFRLNKALDGGTLYITANTTLTLVHCVSNNNSAHMGGVIYGTSSILYSHSSTYVNNIADISSGGAVYLVTMALAHFTNSTFESNSALMSGGGTCIEAEKSEFYNCKFSKNNALHGGGIMISAETSLPSIPEVTLANCTFDRNTAKYGGGVFFTYGNTKLHSCVFQNNQASESGAGVCHIAKSMEDYDSRFYFNNATVTGGAVYSETPAVFQRTIFYGNTASEGAAVDVKYTNSVTTTSFWNCVWQNNIAMANGSCIQAQPSSNTVIDSGVEVHNGTFNSNSLGAIHVREVNLTVTDTTFQYDERLNGFSGDFEGECITYTTQNNSFVCDCTAPTAIGYACESLYPCYKNCLYNNSNCQAVQNGTAFCSCENGYGGDQCEIPPTVPPTPTNPPTNSCAINNGGCAHQVSCTPLGDGGVLCGLCPNGTVGSGYYRCNTTCGDGFCNVTLGENCVTCPRDCNQTTCGICGDNTCDSSENCTNCFQDCGACVPNAPCTPGCVNGDCKAGVCVCKPNWYGPTCSTSSNQQANYTVNNTNPDISVDSPALGNTKFYISIANISEINQDRVPLRGVSIRDLNFTFASEAFGLNTRNNYSVTLENGATIIITVWQLEEVSTTLEFANRNTTYNQHSLKISIRFLNWPFLALTNSLSVTLDAGVTVNAMREAGCINKNEDESGSLLVDGRTRTMSYYLNTNDGTVSAIIPHFWEFADMDPNYSVLLQDNEELVSGCESSDDQSNNNNKKSNKKLVAIIVPVVVGTVILAVALGFLIPKLRDRYKISRLNKESELDNLNFERTPDMELNTSAGKYIVQL